MAAADDEASTAPAADETAEQPGRAAGYVALLVLAGIALLAIKVVVTVAPYTAYFAVGVLSCLAWQRGRRWITDRRSSKDEQAPEVPAPDAGAALRRLVGDDNGVLLTRLRDELKLPDTKALKALLDADGIAWKAVRTKEGNGPGVHKANIPAALSPAPADSHEDGCCCRSGDNGNGDNSAGEGAQEGLRVVPIGIPGAVIHDPSDAVRHHPVARQ
ncbi:hypothetical protein ABTX35_01930 [Streptomyces sp. NPDC096080]|uniref:hypothetical protein n=1 Tax=Streptomyces sp. NPDC096080 TaxID=3156693 RepID=UPI003318D3A6